MAALVAAPLGPRAAFESSAASDMPLPYVERATMVAMVLSNPAPTIEESKLTAAEARCALALASTLPKSVQAWLACEIHGR